MSTHKISGSSTCIIEKGCTRDQEQCWMGRDACVRVWGVSSLYIHVLTNAKSVDVLATLLHSREEVFLHQHPDGIDACLGSPGCLQLRPRSIYKN